MINFGYFAGGNDPGVSTIDRIDYSNDLVVASIKNNLSSGAGARSGVSASGNSNFGYYAGGSSNQSQVTRFNYSNDLSSGVRVNSLNIGRTTCAGLTNARSS